MDDGELVAFFGPPAVGKTTVARTMVMNTDPAVPSPADALLRGHRHLRLDNRAPNPGAAAARIVAWLAGN